MQLQPDLASGRLRVWYNAGYSETGNAIALVNGSGQFTTIASHSRQTSPMLVAADHADIEPSFDRSTPAGADAYTDWCLDFVVANRVQLFVVQRGRSAIARRLGEFAQAGCKALVTADADTLETIENKAQFYRICAAAGLPTPLAISVQDAAGFDAAHAVITGAGHAACIKPPRGVFGSGYFKLDDTRPAFDRLMSIDDRVLPTWLVRAAIAERGSIPDLLVMQHLPGTEWSVDCLCDQGRILAGFVRAKSANSQAISHDEALMALAGAVAAQFNLSNVVNIQFKSATPGTGSPHVLEINPRMSGGCAAGALAGINLPVLQLLHAAGRALPARRADAVMVTSASAMIKIEPAAAAADA